MMRQNEVLDVQKGINSIGDFTESPPCSTPMIQHNKPQSDIHTNTVIEPK
jgi:hypothetical protein